LVWADPPAESVERRLIAEQSRMLMRELLGGAMPAQSDRLRRPSRRAELAYESFRRAEEAVGEALTDKQAYRWLRDHDSEGYELPKSRETWARYLREARRHFGASKYERHPRPPASRSLVGPDGARGGADGKRIIRKRPTP
jgi:hypothetical protein